MIVRFAVLVAVAVSAAGCHRNATAEQQGGTEVTGVVSIVGTSFEQRIELESSGRITRLAATAPDSAALTRLGGVEIAVRGTMENRVMRVASFRAVSVNSDPVIDGIVRVDGQTVSIETLHGRVKLGAPPSPLRQMNGARVWVSGAVDKGPNNYGVIVPVR